MKKELKIQRVRSGVLEQVIELHTPRGFFLTKEGSKWAAVDNTSYNRLMLHIRLGAVFIGSSQLLFYGGRA